MFEKTDRRFQKNIFSSVDIQSLEEVSSLEKQNSDLNKKFKFVTIIGLIALCGPAYLYVIGPFLAVRDEGAPYFVFVEVPVNETVNSTVIHLEDKDFMNILGLDVVQENGKLRTIYFRKSAIHPSDFNYIYGSRVGDPIYEKISRVQRSVLLWYISNSIIFFFVCSFLNNQSYRVRFPGFRASPRHGGVDYRVNAPPAHWTAAGVPRRGRRRSSQSEYGGLNPHHGPEFTDFLGKCGKKLRTECAMRPRALAASSGLAPWSRSRYGLLVKKRCKTGGQGGMPPWAASPSGGERGSPSQIPLSGLSK